MEGQPLRDQFAADSVRDETFTAEAAGLCLDYSKNRIAPETLRLLIQLAEECDLRGRIDAIFRGDHILGRQGDDILGGGPGSDDSHGGLGATRLMGVSPLDRHWFVLPGADVAHWHVYGPSDIFIEHLIPTQDICRHAIR